MTDPISVLSSILRRRGVDQALILDCAREARAAWQATQPSTLPDPPPARRRLRRSWWVSSVERERQAAEIADRLRHGPVGAGF